MCKVTKENMNDVLCKIAKVGGIMIIGGVIYQIGREVGVMSLANELVGLAQGNKDLVFATSEEFNYIVNAVPKGIAD